MLPYSLSAMQSAATSRSLDATKQRCFKQALLAILGSIRLDKRGERYVEVSIHTDMAVLIPDSLAELPHKEKSSSD
jgi:hypothetical protein